MLGLIFSGFVEKLKFLVVMLCCLLVMVILSVEFDLILLLVYVDMNVVFIVSLLDVRLIDFVLSIGLFG